MRILRSVTAAAMLSAMAGCAGGGEPAIGSLPVEPAADALVAEVKARGARAVQVELRDPLMPFAQAYHAHLVSGLTRAGIPVSAAGADTLVVRYDVVPLAYRRAAAESRTPWLTLAGAAAGGAAWAAGQVPAAAGAFAGLAGDATVAAIGEDRATASYGSVVVTTQLLDHGVVVWSDTGNYEVPEIEMANYRGWSSAPTLPVRQVALTELPAQAMAVSGQSRDETGDDLYGRVLRK